MSIFHFQKAQGFSASQFIVLLLLHEPSTIFMKLQGYIMKRKTRGFFIIKKLARIWCFLSSYREKAPEALFIGRIQTRLGVTLFPSFQLEFCF